MARCPKCLILEGSPGALACEMERCPRLFADMNGAQLRAATGDKAGNREFLAGNTTDPESHNQVGKIQPDPLAHLSPHQRAGHTPPKPGSRPRGRARKNGAPVTVFDRDVGVGAAPTIEVRII
jgi:hypothetical protein